jgi:hypothetical protein
MESVSQFFWTSDSVSKSISTAYFTVTSNTGGCAKNERVGCLPTGYLLSTPRLGPRPLAVCLRSGWDPLPAPPDCSSDPDIREKGRPSLSYRGRISGPTRCLVAGALALLRPELRYLPRYPTNIECQYFKSIPPVP